ncbi:hypothetical protein [Saccharopolyspora rhizosphaerae]|uniref:hypothetical protein n=1 Tax=Saccharopolyspora rhizosphaerae TaxID=2492662 RepID=UPI0018F373DC|nr:hypothetical protein [Saccharopolyspora rhizosphaerae]
MSVLTLRAKVNCGQPSTSATIAGTAPERPSKPPKSGGVVVTDEGEGGVGVAEFLAGEKLL